MTSPDAVVVGAGPAGSTAARCLAAAGISTLLLDRAPIGRDKPCGGGLTPRAHRDLDLDIDDLVMSRIRAADLRCAGRPPLVVDLAGATIWMVRRRDLDRRLVEAAAAAGAEVRDRTAVTAITASDGSQTPAAHAGAGGAGGGIVVETSAGDRLHPSVVLLATGAEAPLRRSLGFEAPTSRMAPALELEGEAASPTLDGESFVFDYSTPDGYAWAFPKATWWNAGILTFRDGTGNQLRDRLAAFLEAIQLRFADPALVPQRAIGRRIPLWLRPATIHRGRVALIGDAAGLADPLFGEGIAQAIASGRIGATAAAEVVTGAAPDLAAYPRRLRASLGRHLWRTRQTARVLYNAPALALRGLAHVGPARRAAVHVATEPFRTA